MLLRYHTRDLDQFYRFVNNITTPNGVGMDTAEDVFGGLAAVLKLSWPKDGTKVTFRALLRDTIFPFSVAKIAG